MAVSQSLTLTEISYSTYDNTSQVRIVWKSTQTGYSYTDYGVPGKYYISINGSTESEHSISSKQLLPEMTVTLLDTTIAVPHRDDGTGSISVRTWMNTNVQGIITTSDSLTLTTIARASYIDSVSNQNLGAACSVKWTPKATSFRYKLKFSMGDWSHTTGAIHPNQPIQYTYNGYTIPLDAAKQIPNSKTGRMTVTLYTYRDSNATNQVGSESSETFTVTVPENESTKPSLTMSLSPKDTLDSAFDGLYVQGRSQVTANLSGSGKYGATISSYGMTVDGIGYDSTLESEYLSTSGDIEVVCKVKDTRGFTTEKKQTITVIPYSKPKLVRASDESSIICDRYDESSGNLKEDGTSLKIKVGRSYSKVVSGDTQKNICTLRYRCKLSGGASFTDDDWKTLLLGTDLTTDYVDTVIKNLVPQVNRSYIVEISAIDGIDETSLVCYVATDEVVFHLGEDVDGVAFGKYAEKDKVLEIAPEWDIYYKGDKIDKMFHSDTGWISLTTSGNATSSSNITRSGEGCFYKVINGNHVYVAFNCGFAYSGETVHINTDTIPEAYRPKNNAYTLCPCDNRTIARVSVASDGYIYIGYVQDMASGTSTSSYTAGWIDGYIDYWI